VTEITWRCDAAYLVIYPELEIVGFTDPRPATFPGHAGSAFLSARLFPNSGLSASRHSCTSPSALRPAAFEPGPGCLSFFSDPVGLALTLVKRWAFGTHFCETAIRIGIQESTGRAAITGQESLKERLVSGRNAWITSSFSTRPGARILQDYFEYLGKMLSASIARKRCACQPTRRASFAWSGP